MTSTLQLAGLLVRFRLRSVWNAVWRSPRGRSFRLGWVFVLATPIAYTGLLAVALDTIGQHGGQPMQAAALAVVCGTVVLASVVGKMASSEAVVAGSGENEFFSTKPFGLPRLVLARCLAGTVTNLFDAFFLMPVLVAAALLWQLGVAGILLAAFISMVVQLGVSAFAQGAQVVLVRVISPPFGMRWTVWTVPLP